jgi:DNA-binding CsgD family transcriptional regulator
MNIKPLTRLQRQAYNLRQLGKTIQEIAAIMGRTREPVRQLIARAKYKIKRGIK